MRRALGIIGLCVMLTAGAAHAQTREAPPSADARLLQFDFAPDQVFDLVGHLGYQMMIEFNADERIENVSIGDSFAWQVTPNRAATVLFLKPQSRSSTNMNVVTSRRVYSFSLHVASARAPRDIDIVYRVSFRYAPPPDAAAIPAAAAALPALNFEYSYPHTDEIAPVRVFDDGAATYFQFRSNIDAPAIFILDGRDEEVANAQARDGYLVVDRVAGSFVLRYGRHRTVVRNDAFGGTGEAGQ